VRRSRDPSSAAAEFARNERATANEFENTLWEWIRNRQIHGQKFRREVPIPPYTANFCCLAPRLIFGIDGAEHFANEGRKRDPIRDAPKWHAGSRANRG
jgi:very-short-patch-repair endonuclease